MEGIPRRGIAVSGIRISPVVVYFYSTLKYIDASVTLYYLNVKRTPKEVDMLNGDKHARGMDKKHPHQKDGKDTAAGHAKM